MCRFKNLLTVFTFVNQDDPTVGTVAIFIHAIYASELNQPNVKSVRFESHFGVIESDFRRIKEMKGSVRSILGLLDTFQEVSELEFQILTS